MNKGIWFLVFMVVCLMGFTFTVGYSFVDSTMIYYGIPLAIGMICFLGLSYYTLEVLPRLEKERLEKERLEQEKKPLTRKAIMDNIPGEVLDVGYR